VADTLTPLAREILMDCASIQGRILKAEWPKINTTNTPHISYYITLVAAQMLQAWLDAGSERDNTIEDLWDRIEAHVLSWTEEA